MTEDYQAKISSLEQRISDLERLHRTNVRSIAIAIYELAQIDRTLLLSALYSANGDGPEAMKELEDVTNRIKVVEEDAGNYFDWAFNHAG